MLAKTRSIVSQFRKFGFIRRERQSLTRAVDREGSFNGPPIVVLCVVIIRVNALYCTSQNTVIAQTLYDEFTGQIE